MPPAKKDREDAENKAAAPRSKRQALQGKQKRRGGAGGRDSDDDSVDSRGNIRGLIDYGTESDSESTSDSSYSATSESELSEVEHPRGRRKAAIVAEKRIKKIIAKEMAAAAEKKTSKSTKPRRCTVIEDSSSSSEEEDDSMNLEDEDDEESEEEEESDDEMEQEHGRKAGGIILALGGAGISDESIDRMIPRRYNLKKEPERVRHFVELLTKPMEDNSIDTHIDQFKALPDEKQRELIEALEKRPTMQDSGINLMLRILTLKLPTEVQALILAKYNSLQDMDPSSGEYFKTRNWLDKVVSVPFGTYKDLPVKLDDGQPACEGFMKSAKACMDTAVFGQEETKLQILQFISAKIANPEKAGTSLLLVGPPGVGKTSIIKNGIAKALGWPFQFISLGGDSDASTYTGHQLVYESSHCGKIVNSLVAAKSMSCVILFDEADKLSATPKGEEVQNMLIHLTDPAANGEFEDKYLAGVPINLSKAMFVFTANDITKIDRVLLDRMNVIHLKGYDAKEKLAIAENYLLPSALRDVNLHERVGIGRDIIQHVIERYAAEEKGVRQLKRCLEQIAQKLNMLRMYNAPSLPFHIKDFALPFTMKKEQIELFLKKTEMGDSGPPPGMYI